MTSLSNICRNAWSDSMYAVRISGTLSRIEENKEQTEDDKALINKGMEMLSQIRRYFQFMKFGGALFFNEEEIGYSFFDLMKRKGIEPDRQRELLDLYEKSLYDSSGGCTNENLGETIKFFDDFFGYLSHKVTPKGSI